jgi:hypothetical protein
VTRLLPLPIATLLLSVTILGATPPLVAQQQPTTTPARPPVDTTERPFVRGGVYDKPYQTQLFGRTAIGGYAEAHARWVRADGVREESGFEMKRFNLFTSTQVSDFVRIGAELEIEEGGEEITLEYAAIDFRLHTALTLRAGMLLSPLGRFNLSHDSPRNEFTDRPLVSTDLIGVALSEPGLGVLGQVNTGHRGRVTYELYATNGFNDGLITNSPEGTRVALGRRNVEDNNNSPAVVGRVAWSPRVGHEIGFSTHHGAYNVFVLEGVDVDVRRNLTITVFDLETTVASVRVTGEAARVAVQIPDGLSGLYASRQRGGYLEAAREFGRGWVRTMPQSFFTVKLRGDAVDFDTQQVGHTTAQMTAGVNFRPTRETALKIDFVRGRDRDRFNNSANHAAFLLSMATYF